MAAQTCQPFAHSQFHQVGGYRRGEGFPDTVVCEEDWFPGDEFSADSKQVPLGGT